MLKNHVVFVLGHDVMQHVPALSLALAMLFLGLTNYDTWESLLCAHEILNVHWTMQNVLFIALSTPFSAELVVVLQRKLYCN
jgi:hypothetical protein